MTENLKEHLIRCEKAMEFAKPILGGHSFPTDIRTSTVIGFLSLLIEHHESILILVMHGKTGSASALFRPVVEGAYRALWINHPATENELTQFINKDEIASNLGELARTLDSAYSTEQLFQKFNKLAMKRLHSYTHGGMHQISRRFLKNEVENNYSEDEVLGMTDWVTKMVLLVISLFLKAHGHSDSGDRIQSLLGTYGSLGDDKTPTRQV